MNKYLFSLSCLFLVSCDDAVHGASGQKSVEQKAVPVAEKTEKTPAASKYYQSVISCDDGDLFRVLISDKGDYFEIFLNEEKLVASKDLTAAEKAQTKPIVMKMVENMKALSSAEEFFAKNNRRSALFVYQPENQYTLQTPRMKSRMRYSKDELLDNISDMMRILIDSEDKSNKEAEKPVVDGCPKVVLKNKPVRSGYDASYQRCS